MTTFEEWLEKTFKRQMSTHDLGDPDLLAEYILELQLENKELWECVDKADERLCELIIDTCGYEPEHESKEDLVLSAWNNSDKSAKILYDLRKLQKKYKRD